MPTVGEAARVRMFTCADCGVVGHAGAAGPLPKRCADCKRAHVAVRAQRKWEADPDRARALLNEWRRSNPEKRREQERRYRERYPEKKAAKDKRSYERNRDTRLVASRRRHHANREKFNAYSRAYYEKNRETQREKMRIYYEIARDDYIRRAEERRARKRGATVERVYRRVVWERDGGICHICKLPADPQDWHLEHIVPLIRGGEHSYANVAVSHPLCNRRKSVS